ncbi:MAG: hypothetical protein AB7F99_16330 [Vicinamibacterales bacterium]
MAPQSVGDLGHSLVASNRTQYVEGCLIEPAHDAVGIWHAAQANGGGESLQSGLQPGLLGGQLRHAGSITQDKATANDVVYPTLCMTTHGGVTPLIAERFT